MAQVGTTTQRLFGGVSDQSGRNLAGSTSQKVPETLTVGATSRVFRGPKLNGHYAVMFRNVTASGATSTATIWYSLLPDPDPTSDADWVQDASITAIDLTVVGNTLINAGNVFAEWIRLKVNTVTTAGTAWAYSRTEGSDIK